MVILTHSIPQNKALVPCGWAPAARGMRALFRDLYFCCLGKHSQTETSFKRNFLLMKGQNSITSYCIVLTFKLAKTWWLVKELLVSKALGVYFLWILIESIKMMTQTMDGCSSLNKLEVLESDVVSDSDGNTAVLTVKMWAFLSGFSCPTQILLLSAPILLGPGEVTHLELLGTKRVKYSGILSWNQQKKCLKIAVVSV